MKPKAADRDISNSSISLTRFVRKILLLYLPSAVAVLGVCFIFGWRSLDHIGTGFIYGALGLALFGALTFSGNAVPAKLSQLSLPQYKPSSPNRVPNDGMEDSQAKAEGKYFLVATSICGAFLLLTGLFLKRMS